MSASHDLDRAAAIGAAVWSVCSVAVAATWLIGLPHAFPHLDSAGLPRLAPGPAALLSWAVIGLSVFSAGAAFSALTPGPGRGPRPATLIGFAAGVLAAGVQVVPLPFDLIAVVATGRLPYPLGLGWKLLTAAALLILAHRLRQEGRRARGRCLACGGPHRSPAAPVLDRPEPVMASPATCVVAALCLVAVIPWAAVKIGWGLGATLLGASGVVAGVDITVLAAGAGMVLATLLLARLPRRLPGSLLTVPAAFAAAPLIGYGYPLLTAGLLGLLGLVDPPVVPGEPTLDVALIMVFGGLAFAGIGTALALGAVSLSGRSRPVCRPDSVGPATRVAVIGAGFAGLAAVKQLARAGLRVTLIDQRSYSTFQPLLYQVATGGLNAGDITYPIRTFLARHRGVRFVSDRVTGIDQERSVIDTAGGELIGYDHLIIASGAVANDFGIPGVAEHALPVYTRPDALTVRDRLFGVLEDAARSGTDTDCTVVIVGGGATGIEMAGNLAELRDHGLAESYPELRADQVKIILVEAGDRLLAPFAPGLQRYSLDQLRRRGVDVRLSAPITAIEADAVRFGDGTVLPASLVLWTAGVRGSAGGAGWSLPLNRAGRIRVGPTLQVPGRPEVFAVGDAGVITANPLPQLAQPALQTGRHAARQIIRIERGQEPRRFRYFDKGIMATIGAGAAVVELPVGLTITGPLAWLTWLGIHIVYLLGGRNRVVTTANLAVRYLRPRGFGTIVGDPVRTPPVAEPRPRQPVGR